VDSGEDVFEVNDMVQWEGLDVVGGKQEGEGGEIVGCRGSLKCLVAALCTYLPAIYGERERIS